jgi:hypothetical protein
MSTHGHARVDRVRAGTAVRFHITSYQWGGTFVARTCCAFLGNVGTGCDVGTGLRDILGSTGS